MYGGGKGQEKCVLINSAGGGGIQGEKKWEEIYLLLSN